MWHLPTMAFNTQPTGFDWPLLRSVPLLVLPKYLMNPPMISGSIGDLTFPKITPNSWSNGSSKLKLLLVASFLRVTGTSQELLRQAYKPLRACLIVVPNYVP